MATKIKNIPFIGGDTQTFEFDFGTKVDGSVAECPMRLYASRANAIQAPTNLTWNENTGWNEITGGFGGQSFIDLTKIQDGQFASYSPNSNGNIAQLLVELDLTPLCNSLFGSSTSAMMNALKHFEIHTYAKGSGANGAGVRAEVYVAGQFNNYPSNLGWGPDNAYNSLSTNASIADLPCSGEPSANLTLITSNNRIYILLHATSTSNGTITSEVDLDYINIKLQFARVPDVINPIPMVLPDTWSMLIKGFSPAWDNIPSTLGKMVFMFKKDSSNFMAVDFENPGFINFFKVFNLSYISSEWIYSNSQIFSKFQIFNLLVEQTVTGMRLRVLKNKGSVEKYNNTNVKSFTGSVSLLLGYDFRNSANCGEAFFNSLVFMPNKVFDDDAEAEAVLRGTAKGFEEDELFDYTMLPVAPNVTVNNDIKQINVTNAPQYGGVSIAIPVLPNNQYTITGTIGSNGYINLIQQYNSIYRVINYSVPVPYTFTTDSHCNKIILQFGVLSAGSTQFNNISLKLKM